jgi:ribose 5-phosphate isomerase B
MRIAVGADHGGYNLKEAVKKRLEEQGHQVDDMGVFSDQASDYPEQASEVAKAVAGGNVDRGVLICGSGLGMCMTANRFHGVRGALAPTTEHARLGRAHNNANILCLGERLTPEDQALEILDVFMNTEFESGGRHSRRVGKIDTLTGGQS